MNTSAEIWISADEPVEVSDFGNGHSITIAGPGAGNASFCLSHSNGDAANAAWLKMFAGQVLVLAHAFAKRDAMTNEILG